MTLSRRDFIKLAGGIAGGLALNSSRPALIDALAVSSGEGGSQFLADLGYFPDISPHSIVFDESKYSPHKRELEPSEWGATNRHMPIKIPADVLNHPGERSQEALKRVIEYTGFRGPRYESQPEERVSMCNIAAWDWARALRLHLPHWKGETEMSANMLFRWISHPEAGGVYGEGWQAIEPPVPEPASGIRLSAAGFRNLSAQLLANRGIPVFALAENPDPSRHGHVAIMYPKRLPLRLEEIEIEPDFATVKSGRSRSPNGIMGLRSAFRHLSPAYFVHLYDFVLHKTS
jgi:hypothetical protein